MIPRRRKEDRFGWTLPGVVLGLLGMAAVTLSSGCAGWGIFSNCIKGQSPQDVMIIVAKVIAIVDNPASTEADIVNGVEALGPAGPCIAAALAADFGFGKAHPATVEKLKRLTAHERASGRLRACK